MNTTRRQFLASLGGAALAPLAIAAAIKGGSTPQPRAMEITAAGFTAPPPLVLKMCGEAIKVPSNRVFTNTGLFHEPPVHWYDGEWDGAFKLERGCSNPAYILADLMERTGVDHDWVTHVKTISFDVGGASWDISPLNWPMLYDYGRWCDTLVSHAMEIHQDGSAGTSIYTTHACPRARCVVNAACHSHADLVTLRETLRMHCLSWQSTDSRYRTSWPVS